MTTQENHMQTFTADGVSQRREAFSSFPDQVLVMQLTASKPGSATDTLRLTDAHKADVTPRQQHDQGSRQRRIEDHPKIQTHEITTVKLVLAACLLTASLANAGTKEISNTSQGVRHDDQTSAVTERAAGQLGLSLNSPLNWQVIQRRSLREGVIPVTGNYSVTCSRIEVRIAGKTKWNLATLNKETKTFTAQLLAPAGGWYEVEVRAVKGLSTVATAKVEHVGVGEVFVGAGQSNSTSCGGLNSTSPLDGRTKPLSGMVTTFNGSTWRIADDPQPGSADEKRYAAGSFWPAFGDAMAAKYHVPIGVAVTGCGSTSINKWKKNGELFNWSLARMQQLGTNGFRAVLWHQGESDKNMPAQQYADGLGQIIRDFRAAAGWEMPWFVANASSSPGNPLNEAGARGGQKLLWQQKIAFEGPDTDVMLGDLRDFGGTGIHFSKKGLKVHGEAWAEKVGAWLDQELKQ
jgi:hypothetical protein